MAEFTHSIEFREDIGMWVVTPFYNDDIIDKFLTVEGAKKFCEVNQFLFAPLS